MINPSKIDPNGLTPESFAKQMLELKGKLEKLEMEDKQLKIEFREYKIENEKGKNDSQRQEDENEKLKLDVIKLTSQYQKQFSETMDAKMLLT